jgi:hypothetical protein
MTDWTPFPAYGLTLNPIIGRDLNTLKGRYDKGHDYYQETQYDPPYMNPDMIADFEKVYDKNIDRLVDMYKSAVQSRRPFRLEDHFHDMHFGAGAHEQIVKVSKVCHKIQQLVHFEQQVHSAVRAKEEQERRTVEAWKQITEQSAGPWPNPGSPPLLNFAVARIQKLEATVERLIKENEDLYRILTETRI